jgi:hypothetical protein
VRRRVVVFVFLAGCPTVDLGDTPVQPPLCRPNLQKFREPGGIWDTAVAPASEAASCVSRGGCHAQATGRSALRLIVRPRDQMTDSDWSTNLDVVARFLNCSTPSDSLFITKPLSGLDPHLGGDLWTCVGECEPVRTVEAWIEAR